MGIKRTLCEVTLLLLVWPKKLAFLESSMQTVGRKMQCNFTMPSLIKKILQLTLVMPCLLQVNASEKYEQCYFSTAIFAPDPWLQLNLG